MEGIRGQRYVWFGFCCWGCGWAVGMVGGGAEVECGGRGQRGGGRGDENMEEGLDGEGWEIGRALLTPGSNHRKSTSPPWSRSSSPSSNPKCRPCSPASTAPKAVRKR